MNVTPFPSEGVTPRFTSRSRARDRLQRARVVRAEAPAAEGPASRDLSDPPEVLVDQLTNRWARRACGGRVLRKLAAGAGGARPPPLARAPNAPGPRTDRGLCACFAGPRRSRPCAQVPDDPPPGPSGGAGAPTACAGPRVPSGWPRNGGARPGRRAEDRKVRDYYRVEDEEGRRFWMFRAGLYAPDAGAALVAARPVRMSATRDTPPMPSCRSPPTSPFCAAPRIPGSW